MASEKQLNVRIQHKHDIEANWQKATNFTPKAGELIIYDADENFELASKLESSLEHSLLGRFRSNRNEEIKKESQSPKDEILL